jgi:hypothetical protein
MDPVLKLPIDLPHLPASRRMKELLGDDAKVVYAWFILFQELKYRCQEGGAAGSLSKAEWASVLPLLSPDRSESGREPAGDPERGRYLEKLGRLLIESRVLVEDGEEIRCPRFAALHGGDLLGDRTMAQRGGDMRAFSIRMKRLNEGGAFQLGLHISDRKMVDEEGRPLEADTCKRVTRLIVACDNALFKSERPPLHFTEGLIQDALAVTRHYTDEEIDHVLRTIAKNRSRPVLIGMSTEKLLPRFAEYTASPELTV